MFIYIELYGPVLSFVAGSLNRSVDIEPVVQQVFNGSTIEPKLLTVRRPVTWPRALHALALLQKHPQVFLKSTRSPTYILLSEIGPSLTLLAPLSARRIPHISFVCRPKHVTVPTGHEQIRTQQRDANMQSNQTRKRDAIDPDTTMRCIKQCI